MTQAMKTANISEKQSGGWAKPVSLCLQPVTPQTWRQVCTSVLSLLLIRAILSSAVCWQWQELGQQEAAVGRDGTQERGA